VLTPAEWQVVNAVRHGLSNRQIAVRRGISLDAVKFHVRNALGKLGLANREALRRWRGAPRTSPLRRFHSETKPMTASMPLALGPVAQIARTVRDIDAARQWYAEVLGLKELFSFDKMAFFDCGGTRLYLQAADEPTAESILYLRAADILAAHAELTARGVEFLGAPHMVHRHGDGTEEWMAFFKDPEGRSLALMSQVPPTD
jgi:DNA-binding CsgD family transcriptional regulator/extradiol dioxygenase family protein